MTQLPNPFLNSSVISPRTEESAVASKPPPVADATAAPVSVSYPVPRYDEPANVCDDRCTIEAQSQTDHIHEIFHYARKLLTDHPDFVGFIFDEAAFMADVEETPLFIREDGYLKRQA